MAIVVCTALAAPAAALANPTWLGPHGLSEGGQSAEYLDAAMGSGGGAALAWVRSDGTYLHVQVASRAPFASFAPPVDVSPTKQDGDFPQVAVDAAGDATVAWDNVTATATVEAATIVDGMPSAPVTLSGGATSALFPTVAANDRGDAVVAWQQSDGKNEIVWAVFHSAGGGFGAPVALSAPGANATFPRVSIDAAGDATVVWARSSGKNETVQAAFRPVGGGFGAAATLAEAGGSPAYPFVAMNSVGDTAVAWQSETAPKTRIVQAATRPAGSAGFGAVQKASGEEAEVEAIYPEVALDGRGDPTVVWMSGETIQSATGTPSGPFSPLQEVATIGIFPSIAEDPAGDTLVGYLDVFGKAPTAAAVFRPAGGSFLAPRIVSPAGQPVPPTPIGDELGLNVAVDEQGDGLFGFRAEVEKGKYSAQQNLLDAAGPILRSSSLPASATVGTPVAFSVAPVDQLSPAGSTSWSFGDASTASGPSVTHTFAAPGTYTLSVTSTDSAGNSTTQTAKITVTAPTAPASLAFHAAALYAGPVTADRHGHVQLKVTCPAGGEACAGTVTLTLPATATGLAVAARARKTGTPVTVAAGHAAFSAAPGAGATVSISLPSAVAKLLAQHRHLTLTAIVESRDSSGQSASRSARLLVKAAPKPKPKKKKRRR